MVIANRVGGDTDIELVEAKDAAKESACTGQLLDKESPSPNVSGDRGEGLRLSVMETGFEPCSASYFVSLADDFIFQSLLSHLKKHYHHHHRQTKPRLSRVTVRDQLKRLLNREC